MTRPALTVSFEWEYENPLTFDLVPITVEADVSAYYPAVMYLRNGDPGYPAEGGEIEDIRITKPDGTPFHAPWPVLERFYFKPSARFIPFEESLDDIIQEKAEAQAYDREEDF
jgi:hypothetical protein